MNTIRSKNIKVGGLGVRYLTGGQGEPLIVLHGGSGQGAHDWRKSAAELAKNYTVFVPDMPGFGQTEPLTGDYFLPELAEFVDGFSRELGLEKFHLMGHSLGGGIALSYALNFPQKITKLVLVSSLCLGKEIALWIRFLANPQVIRHAGRVATGALKAAVWVAEVLMLAPFAMPFSMASISLGRYVTGIREQTTVFLSRLSEIAAPTLLVWGSRDPILPYRQAYAAAELIPDCRVKVFDGAGHSVYRERLDEFSLLLKGFLG